MSIVDGLVLLGGLAIGSFLNVCIYRIPKGQSIVLPASRCPDCDHRLRPWHNLPLLGYALLRGRCADCGAAISWVYPFVEALTALLFWASYLKFDLSPPFWISLAFLSLLIVLNFIDLYHRLLPDALTLGGAAVGFALAPWQSMEFFGGDPLLPIPDAFWIPYLHSLAGILAGGGVLWLVAALYLKLRKIEGMGFGDVKMMAMVGAFLGWRYAWLTIFAGSLAGAMIGSIFIYATGRGQRYELPFGTFLAIGAVLALFWGPFALNAYLELFAE